MDRDAFTAPDIAQSFRGSGLDVDPVWKDGQIGSDMFPHGGNVWGHARSLGDDRGVCIAHCQTLFPQQGRDPPQQN